MSDDLHADYHTFVRNMRKVMERHGLDGDAVDARMKELLASERFKSVIEILDRVRNTKAQ